MCTGKARMHRNGVALSPCSPRPHLSSSRATSQLLDHRNPLHAVVIVHNPGCGGLDVRSTKVQGWNLERGLLSRVDRGVWEQAMMAACAHTLSSSSACRSAGAQLGLRTGRPAIWPILVAVQQRSRGRTPCAVRAAASGEVLEEATFEFICGVASECWELGFKARKFWS